MLAKATSKVRELFPLFGSPDPQSSNSYAMFASLPCMPQSAGDVSWPCWGHHLVVFKFRINKFNVNIEFGCD